jgi:hypothetical protein
VHCGMCEDSGCTRDAGVNVLSTSGIARASSFHIGRGAENQTRSRRVSFAAIKRATAAAKASRADWEHQRWNTAAPSASKSCQARVVDVRELLGRSDLFILLRGGRCAGLSRFLIDEIDECLLAQKLGHALTTCLPPPDVPTSPHHRTLTFTHDFTIFALSSTARPSHCHALTQNTPTSRRPFPTHSLHGRGVRRLFAPARVAGLTAIITNPPPTPNNPPRYPLRHCART